LPFIEPKLDIEDMEKADPCLRKHEADAREFFRLLGSVSLVGELGREAGRLGGRGLSFLGSEAWTWLGVEVEVWFFLIELGELS
jgi:hypothetical protein